MDQGALRKESARKIHKEETMNRGRLLMAGLLAVLLAGCVSSPRQMIVGTWEMDADGMSEEERMAMAMFGGSIEFEFSRDGKVSMNAGVMGMNLSMKGEYQWTGDDKIKMKMDLAGMFGAGEGVEAGKEEEFTVKVSKNKLELIGPDGDPLKLKRKQ